MRQLMVISQKKFVRIVIVAALVLLIPLISMQYSEDVNWSLLDFTTAGVLLLIAGLAYELLLARTKNAKQRAIVGAVITVLFLWMWIELAVGLFTNLGN